MYWGHLWGLPSQFNPSIFRFLVYLLFSVYIIQGQWEYYYWQGWYVGVFFWHLCYPDYAWNFSKLLYLFALPMVTLRAWWLAPDLHGPLGPLLWMRKGIEERAPQESPVHVRYELCLLFHKWWAAITLLLRLVKKVAKTNSRFSQTCQMIIHHLWNFHPSQRKKIWFSLKCV